MAVIDTFLVGIKYLSSVRLGKKLFLNYKFPIDR
jgi:hypothetical protein